MKVTYRSFHLPFRYPFTIAHGTKTHQPTLIVALDHFGLRGYGEAPAITYYQVTVEKMIEDLEKKKSYVEKFAFTEPERYWHYLHHLFPDNPFLVCALDMAAWDLYGKLKRKPLYQLWKLDSSRMPVTDYTIGLDTPEQMIKKMKEKPWPVYKIKAGAEQDISLIKSLRNHSNAVFRVDVNAGWTQEVAIQKFPLLKELGVEFIEQPLPKNNWNDMKLLFKKSPLPLIADESCVSEEDVERCQGYFHGINIKLTKCGGITPARRMIQKAKTMDLKIMLGCMSESTIGTAAIAHLLPLADYADLDGPLLLSEDLATGIGYHFGKIIYSDAPGLGVHPTFTDF